MVGLISFYSPGSAGQLTVGVLWSTLFIFIANWCRPYTTQFANALKAAMDAAILVTMVLSLTIKTDLNRPGEDMSLESVGVLMILSNVLIPGSVQLFFIGLMCADDDVFEKEIDELFGGLLPCVFAHSLALRSN